MRLEPSTGKKKFWRRYAKVLTLIVTLAAIFAIALLVASPVNVALRFGASILVLIASGEIIAGSNGIASTYGAYMLGSRRGIKLIDEVSQRNKGFWLFLADWGLVLGFGLASHFVFKRHGIGKRAFVAGIITILLILLFVFPYLSLVIGFINIPQLAGYSSAPAVVAPQAQLGAAISNTFFLAVVAISLLLGFAGAIVLLLLYSGGIIVYGIAQFLVTLGAHNPNYLILNQQVPGVAPLIPGITIPLFAGIIALFVLLVVHEFSHGVLARIAGVRIKAIGVVLFGIVPFGAYVEPDEKAVKRLKKQAQDRISIAGISANMATSLLFFLLTLLLIVAVLPAIDTGGVLVTQAFKNYSAYNVIEPNSIIVKWNNYTIRNTYDLAKAEAAYVQGNAINLTTNVGVFSLIPNKQGRIGIAGVPARSTLQLTAASFLYSVAALAFGLNFFVAIANLLPLPFFDGWRIYENRIRSKKVLRLLSAVAIAAIIINILPWLWQFL